MTDDLIPTAEDTGKKTFEKRMSTLQSAVGPHVDNVNRRIRIARDNGLSECVVVFVTMDGATQVTIINYLKSLGYGVYNISGIKPTSPFELKLTWDVPVTV